MGGAGVHREGAQWRDGCGCVTCMTQGEQRRKWGVEALEGGHVDASEGRGQRGRRGMESGAERGEGNGMRAHGERAAAWRPDRTHALSRGSGKAGRDERGGANAGGGGGRARRARVLGHERGRISGGGAVLKLGGARQRWWA
jgi:hypothetical protein